MSGMNCYVCVMTLPASLKSVATVGAQHAEILGNPVVLVIDDDGVITIPVHIGYIVLVTTLHFPTGNLRDLSSGTIGVIKQALAKRALVDMGMYGCWYIPYYFLSVPVAGA